MPLVPALCPNCSGKVNVDSEKDAAICQYCGTPFIIEKAITQYNTNNNINIDNVTIINSGIRDFEISGGVLKKYNGSSLTPVIPVGVVAIEGAVFAKSMITEVILPSTLKEIRTDYFESPSLGSFQFCEYLEKINLPEGLRSIGERTFCRCEKLKDINIPGTVEIIGEGAFAYCENLEKVIIEGDTIKGFNNAFNWLGKIETVLCKKNGVLVNPLDSYESLINSPFSNWTEVECTFRGTPFYQKYWNVRCKAENRCLKCGSVLSKRMFSNEYYCKNCDRLSIF